MDAFSSPLPERNSIYDRHTQHMETAATYRLRDLFFEALAIEWRVLRRLLGANAEGGRGNWVFPRVGEQVAREHAGRPLRTEGSQGEGYAWRAFDALGQAVAGGAVFVAVQLVNVVTYPAALVVDFLGLFLGFEIRTVVGVPAADD